MHIRLTPAEAVALARLGGTELPPVITSVAAEGDTVRVSADLRRLDDLPGPLRLAVRIAPVVRADVRVVEFDDGVATLAVEAHASGLPAHRLLGLLATPLERVLTSQGLPEGAVDIRPDATIAVDTAAILAEKVPGLDVTGVRVEDGEIVLDGVVG